LRILITGGAGFIGSNFIRYLAHAQPAVSIINFDKLTYAANLENLADIPPNAAYHFVQGDLSDAEAVRRVFAESPDAAINFAAETHVDRSIEDPAPFLRTNVLGTHCLLEAARRYRTSRFIQISTDEVYGSAPADQSFTEQAVLDPRNPYAASKASGEHLVTAYANTYGIPAIILRSSNNYGPFQFPEKFIPLAIANAREGKPIPIYGDGLQQRDWLFVEDYCRAIHAVLLNEKLGFVYNVSTGVQQTNLHVARTILRCLGKPESLIEHVQDRPGHDRRYALNSAKFQNELGWKPGVNFQDGIQKTIDWYLAHSEWLDHVRSGEYRRYYERHYTRRSETFR